MVLDWTCLYWTQAIHSA